MKKTLGIDGFPIELTSSANSKSAGTKPIPTVEFDKKPGATTSGNLFNEKIKIYVTPTEYFKTKFRDIFIETVISHRSGKESRKWLANIS